MLSLEDMIRRLPLQMKNNIKTILYYGSLHKIIPKRLFLGKTFWKTFILLHESQWWDREEHEEYQKGQLALLLHHSYNNVPYYRKVFEERGLTPNDIIDVKDLKKLPYLEKDSFKLHFNEIVARNFDRKRLRITKTSGTTGKPLQFYQLPEEKEVEWAFVCHQWIRVGYLPGEKRIEFRGPILKGREKIIYDPMYTVLRFSPYVENVETAKYYLKVMSSFKARFLHGYPSAIAYFAHMIRKNNLKVTINLKAVLFTSEPVYDWERDIVQEVFNTRVFSHYGLTEHVATAAECEYSSDYHFVPQYGIVEIDPATNEIIATGFLNYVNPFIRYRTGDYVSSPIYQKCRYCGRSYLPIVKNIQGRLEDIILTPKGVPISPATITHPFKDLKTIRETQIIQESIDRLVLRIVLWDRNSKASNIELETLINRLQKIFTNEMKIDVEVVDEIKRLESGKFKWIISKVARDLIEKGFDVL